MKKEERLVIEVNNLVKRYGNHTAVDHLSFKIEKGKIYGFLGPNGAGKSTTMNMITGYIASTEGTVTIDGHDTGRTGAGKEMYRLSAGNATSLFRYDSAGIYEFRR